MVKLLIGTKGTGKTKKMIDMANERLESSNGNIVFINKNDRLIYDLNHSIRVVSMEEYEQITNSDEYIGFIYGIISGDHDIEVIYIDSILKHTNVNVEDIPKFLNRLRDVAERHKVEFIVSLSVEKETMLNLDIPKFEILN